MIKIGQSPWLGNAIALCAVGTASATVPATSHAYAPAMRQSIQKLETGFVVAAGECALAASAPAPVRLGASVRIDRMILIRPARSKRSVAQ